MRETRQSTAKRTTLVKLEEDIEELWVASISNSLDRNQNFQLSSQQSATAAAGPATMQVNAACVTAFCSYCKVQGHLLSICKRSKDAAAAAGGARGSGGGGGY